MCLYKYNLAFISELLLLVFSFPTTAQAVSNDSISSRFMQQLLLFPQEKLYLHTDKPAYVAGDTIWFRAHVVDAASHLPVSVSRYVYVELADQADSVIYRVKIRVNDSIYSGYLPLELTIPQDNYHLRAYTPFMKNLPQEALFDMSLQVYNPLVKRNRMQGEVATANQNQGDAVLSSFLDIENNDKYLTIRLVPAFADKLRFDETLYLVLHCRGVTLFTDTWVRDRKQYIFDKESFPAGVIQILLLDEHLKPLARQLFFSDNKDLLNIDFVTKQSYYGLREKVECELLVTDKEGKPLKGNFSVSVTDDAFVQTDNICTIDSYLLWKSDWTDNEKDWFRYDVNRLLRGDYQYPFCPIGNSQEIKGITSDYYNHRVKPDTKISLFAMGYLFEKQQRSDSLGKFSFTGFEFPEGTPYLIRTEGKRGSKTIQAIVEPEIFYPFKTKKGKLKDLSVDTVGYGDIYWDRFDSLAQTLKSYQLGEIVVKADAVCKSGKSVFHSIMGKVKTSDELMNPRSRSLEDMLRRFPGVYIGGSDSIGVFVRGCVPIFLLDDVQVDYESLKNINVDEIDEIEVISDASAAMFGMKGANGVVLIMTKRGKEIPSDSVRNVLRFVPLGYQQEKCFCSLKYDTVTTYKVGREDFRTTLYWNPCISVSDKGKASFDFYTSDSESSRTVSIQGVSSDGQIISVNRKVLFKK